MNSLGCSLLLASIMVFSAVQLANSQLFAQPAATVPQNQPAPLLLQDFRPKPALRVKETQITRAKFPVLDVHTHFRIKLPAKEGALQEFLATMDELNIAGCVSLDGQIGELVSEHRAKLPAERFAIFANLDFRGDGKADQPATWACNRPDFGHLAALSLRDAKTRGACGLKLFKQFGLEYADASGKLLQIDDPRFDAIWETCGEQKMPVLIHVADPAAFFEPIDTTNERWEELSRHPDWSFADRKRFPRREELLAAFLRFVERHPKTIFIAAHVANYAEDLSQASEWLDKYPNLYMEFASRIAELGRQPYTARAFCIKYADRLLFGTDGPWPKQRLLLYFRFLETYDENFPYSEKDFPPQGLWRIHGIGLPDDVLKKIYHENAVRLLPELAKLLPKESR